MTDTSACGPVFIAGCGRSGTSYIRTLVDAHPDVYIPSESLFLVDYLRLGERKPGFLLRWLLHHEPQLLCWYEGEPVRGASLIQTIARLHETMAAGVGARVWGQKTPRFVRYRALFEHAFPGSRWILVYRDPRAVVASMRRSGQHTNSVSRGCKRWLRDNREIVALIEGSEVRPENVMLVKYEELVSRFEKTMGDMIQFLQLAPVPMETLQQAAKPVFFSRSGFENNTIRGGVRPDPRRINDWQGVLTEDEVAAIEKACGREMEVLGYEYSTSRSPGASFFWKDLVNQLSDARIIYRYLRYWPGYLLYTILRKLLLYPVRLLARV